MVAATQLLTFLIASLAAFACEKECMNGTTTKFLEQYNPVIIDVLQTMANKIDAECIPPTNRRQDSISYFTPVFHAFDKVSYNGLEHAIFPSYFHGKCRLPNGTEPAGCPNPDCPVVCGTPGSMVHFYPVLTRLVYDEVSGQLINITSPGSKTYNQVKKMVVADAQTKRRRALSRVSRFTKLEARATSATEKKFRAIMVDFSTMFLAACGGSNLSQCKWETYMKKFILQYP